MALGEYKKKRNFKSTAEPEGTRKSTGNQLIFVIQQHAASHLHYDFRLEMEGVLKSWAVPKGPSMNPDDKRLAMMVEDHPYDYKDFEGNIPPGNYGAGNVIVWDNGTYEHINANDGAGEKELLAGLKKGHISFIMHGKKLKGEFSLIKLRGKQENAWLLIKKNDKYASDKDILLKNKSIKSGKTLEQLEKMYGSRKSDKAKPGKTKTGKEKTPASKKTAGVKESKLPTGKKKAQEKIKPMLAEIGSGPFDHAEWIFEKKYDGYRAVTNVNKGKVEMYSRNLLSFNKQYEPLVKELSKLKHDAILDGEVVVEDKEGRSGFQLLQNYENSKTGTLKYYVFDLIYLNGYYINELPLIHRKELLKTLLTENKMKNIIYSAHVAEKGNEFYKSAVSDHLEGMIAKEAQSPYRFGKRSKEWLKIKIQHQQETVIVGFTPPEGSRKFFGSLILAVYENNHWKYVGNAGTGFTEKSLEELYKKFKPLFTKQSPFNEKINVRGAIQWLKPELVCEIKFTEWTKDNSMRHPVFLGLRKDKKPTQVKRELTPLEMKKANAAATPSGKKTGNHTEKNHSSAPGKSSSSAKEKEILLKVGKVELTLTNQHKIYWPKEGYTKGDLVKYYDSVADIILPYLKDRPQSMHRFPNGINAASFFQKDVDTDKIPSWLKTQQVYSGSTKEYIDYLICNDKATLLYMANLGCIEINPWNSRITSPENPDWVVIDLDPEDISFKEVVKAALAVKETFDELEINCYCKTSGASGLHVYVPLNAKYDYDTVKAFAELVANLVHEKIPATTSILRMPAKRKNKVYLDFLQNRRGQTLAAPYSVRPKPGATVSTPLQWNEVNEKLDPSQFTMLNMLKRIEKKGDLWKPVIGKGENLEKAIKVFEKRNAS